MNEPLTVYVLPECVQCTMTTRALEAAGVPYVLVDLASDANAVETVTQLGYASAPVVVTGGASWSGFQPGKIKAMASARAADLYAVPIDPMDELQCDSCQ
jgi:Glutaredoxin and related proteins